MGYEAVGMYVRTLIERQPGLTFKRVHERAGVSTNFLNRLEGGDTKSIYARNLVALVIEARGSVEHMAELLLASDATKEQAKRFAEARLGDLARQTPTSTRAQAAVELRRLADRIESGLEDLPPVELR